MIEWLSETLRLQPACCSTSNLAAASSEDACTRSCYHHLVLASSEKVADGIGSTASAALHRQPACRGEKLDLTHSATACISWRLAWSLAWHVSPGRKGVQIAELRVLGRCGWRLRQRGQSSLQQQRMTHASHLHAFAP